MAVPRDQIVNCKASAEELETLKGGGGKRGDGPIGILLHMRDPGSIQEGDPIAIKIFKENVSTFVKVEGKVMQELLEDIFAPMKGENSWTKSGNSSGSLHKRCTFCFRASPYVTSGYVYSLGIRTATIPGCAS